MATLKPVNLSYSTTSLGGSKVTLDRVMASQTEIWAQSGAPVAHLKTGELLLSLPRSRKISISQTAVYLHRAQVVPGSSSPLKEKLAQHLSTNMENGLRRNCGCVFSSRNLDVPWLLKGASS